MKLQPLISWWLLAPYIVGAVAFCGWQFMKIRRKKNIEKTAIKRWIFRTAVLLMPAIVALGVSVPGGVSSPGVANLDVLFVVDTTPSMGALDYNGNQQRIEGVKQDMLALADSMEGAHMEIITFDSSANVILPLTTDSTAFTTAVEGLTPQINSYSQGSTIDKPINLVTQELKNGAAAYPEHFRLVFYFGDGEQTAQGAVKSFSAISNLLSGGAVLGYGTTKGAQMVKFTGLDNATPTYITTIDTATNKLKPAVSNMNPTNLQKIATELKVTYQDRNSGGPIDGLYQDSKAPLAVDKSQRVIHYLNLYWLLAVPYAGLIFWEWQLLITKLLEMRDHKDAKSQPHRGGRHA